MNKLFEFGKTYLITRSESGPSVGWKEQAAPQEHLKYSLLSNLPLVEQVAEVSSLVAPIINTYAEVNRGKHGEYWCVFVEPSQQESFEKRLTATQLDYLKWPSQTASSPSLLLFDMDSTFIEIEVIDQLAYEHNVGEQVAEVTEKAMRGELDFAESLIERVSCLKGLSETAIEKIRSNLPLSKGIESLVEKASKNGVNVAIVSGGFTPFVERLKESMGLYAVKANRLQMTDGALTGEVKGEIVDAQAKADFLQDLCDQLDLSVEQTMAIGDGANDLKMMQAAAFNLAYRAKPAVQAAASGRFIQSDFERLIDIFEWN